MRWLRHKQPAQDLVQFGLMTAAVAIVALAGLEFLSGTIRWYFGDVAPTLAPPAASVPGFPLHRLTLSFTCDKTAVLVGNAVNCTAVLTDPDSLGPAPISGNLAASSSPGGQFGGCSSFSTVAANAVSCGVTFPAAQAGQFDLTVAFTPKSNHVAADTSTAPVHVTVFGVPSLKLTCGPTSVAVDSPSVCTGRLQTSGASPSGLSNRALTWSVTPAGSGTLTCSTTSSCPSPTSCTTDSNGQCAFVFRPGPTLGQDTVTVAFARDDASTFNPPYDAASTSTAISVTAPVMHDTDADVDWCNVKVKDSVLHCQVTITDLYPAPNPPDPNTDARVPPTGSVTITTEKSLVQNSTCNALTPFQPDHSTCYFDLVRKGDDHDQVSVTYGGDAIHSANTQFDPLDVHFD